MSEKFIGYFRLVDACEREGCPVCACLDEDSHRAVDAILSEHVTDPDTRGRLRETWGFCNWHTWSLLEGEAPATGAAILYEDLVHVCQQRVQRLRECARRPLSWPLRWLRTVVARGARRQVPRIVAWYRVRPPCPVCARLGVAEKGYLDAFVEFADDPQLSRAYRRSTGLCLPHLLVALERSPETSRIGSIVRSTLAKWQELRGDLARFVTRHEYRNTEPFTEAEATSYRRAAEVLAGRRSLFGNGMSRADAPGWEA